MCYSLIFLEFDSVEASTTGSGVAGALKNRNTFHICHSAPVELQRSHSRRRVPTTGSWTDVIVQRIRPLCNWSTTCEKYSTASDILSTLGPWWTFSEQRMSFKFHRSTVLIWLLLWRLFSIKCVIYARIFCDTVITSLLRTLLTANSKRIYKYIPTYKYIYDLPWNRNISGNRTLKSCSWCQAIRLPIIAY